MSHSRGDAGYPSEGLGGGARGKVTVNIRRACCLISVQKGNKQDQKVSPPYLIILSAHVH